MASDIYTFLENNAGQSYVGVDAVTFTARSNLAFVGMRAALDTLAEYTATADRKPFSYQGAKGWSAGSVRYAERFDRLQKRQWAILMVTGQVSQGIVKFFDFDLNASRVDLRVDVQMKSACIDFAERCYKVSPKQLEPRLVQSLVGSTFYPDGNREATFYGRVYDKSPEYGLGLGNVWRYEVECKRKSASPIVSQLIAASEEGDGEEFISDTVFGIFGREWRTPTPKVGVVPKMNYVGASVSSPEAKLDWLRRNVAPTVKLLRRLGYGDQLDAVLGYTQPELLE